MINELFNLGNKISLFFFFFLLMRYFVGAGIDAACMQPLNPGKCISYRSYYDIELNECRGGYTFGVCVLETDLNNFDTIEECERKCKQNGIV